MKWLIALIVFACAFANAEVQKHPFFYKVEAQGKTSFMLGTMHTGVPLNSFPNEIWDHFDRCTINVFEGDAYVWLKTLQPQIESRKKYPAGHSLRDVLSSSAIEKLKTMFNDKIFEYKPWVVNFSIMDSGFAQMMKTLGPDWNKDSAIDETLLSRAKSRSDIKIEFLDREEDKLDQIEASTSPADLEKILSYDSPIDHEVQCGIKARDGYLAGSELALNKYDAECETPEFLHYMDQRTHSWIPKITAILGEGNACFAFGAGHLYGDNGVIKALESQGFKVTRLP